MPDLADVSRAIGSCFTWDDGGGGGGQKKKPGEGFVKGRRKICVCQKRNVGVTDTNFKR